MLYHPDIAAEIAHGRAGELHDAAARARRSIRREQTRHVAHQQPTAGLLQLDAYPRLCGLPVTIERLATNGATAYSTSRAAIAPDSSTGRNPDASGRAKRPRRQPVRLPWLRIGNG